jgi:O-antigen/teichoic acid export membrane protein
MIKFVTNKTLALFLNLLTTLLLVNILSTENFGYYNLALSVSIVLTSILSLGLSRNAYYDTDLMHANTFMMTILIIMLKLVILLLIIIILLLFFNAEKLSPVIIALACLLCLCKIFEVAEYGLEKKSEFNFIKSVTLQNSILYTVLKTTAILWTHNWIVVFILLCLQSLTSNLRYLFRMSQEGIESITLGQLKSLLQYSKIAVPYYAALICTATYSRVDLLILNYYHNATDVGVYSITTRFPEIITTASIFVTTFNFPKFIDQSFADNAHQKVHFTSYLKVQFKTVMVFILISTCSLLFLDVIFEILKPGFMINYHVYLLYSLACLCWALMAGSTRFLIFLKFSKTVMVIHLVGLLVSFASGLLLIPIYGVTGAVITTFCAYFTSCIMLELKIAHFYYTR